MTLYYLLLFVTPFHNDPRLGMTLIDIGSGMIVTPVKVLGVLTVAAAILAPRPRANVPRLRNTLRPLFLLFAVIPVFAILLSPLPIPTAQISQLISAALLLMATGIMVRTKERMLKSVRILVLAFAFSSLWVYKQYFIEHVGRAYGVEGESNYEALMLLLSMPMGFWMWNHESTVWWRRLGLACGALLTGAVLLTQSRAGIIAAGMIAVLAAVRSRHKLAGLALLMVAVSVTLAYGPAGLSQRFRSIRFTGEAENGDEGSTRIHVELLKAGVRMMESHPLLGVGMGQFKQVAPEYNPEIFKISTNSFIAHNLFIQTGAECGVPVLLLFVMMIAVALRNLGIAWRTADQALSALGRSMQTALIAISIVATSITVEGLPFWILIFFSQNLREIVSAEIARTKVDDSMVVSAEATAYGTKNVVTARLPVRTPNTVRT